MKRFAKGLRVLCAALILALLAGSVPALAASGTVYVQDNTLKVYSKWKTSSKCLGTMGYGESMTCLAVNGDWARVQNGGQIGYCKKSGLTLSNPNTLKQKLRIRVNGTKIYARPTTKAKAIWTVNSGSALNGIAQTPDGQWYRVQAGKHYGYVQRSKTTQGQLVYCRAWAAEVDDKSGKKIAVLSFGQSVSLVFSDDNRAAVESNSGVIGYMDANMLTGTNPNTLNGTMYVQANGAQMYAQGWMAKRMNTLKKNTAVAVVAYDAQSDIYRVKYKGKFGYMRGIALRSEKAASLVAAYITGTEVPLREGAAANSGVISTLNLGAAASILNFDGDSARIRLSDGTTGYVNCDKLSFKQL